MGVWYTVVFVERRSRVYVEAQCTEVGYKATQKSGSNGVRPSTPPVGAFELGTTGICVAKKRGRLRLVDLSCRFKPDSKWHFFLVRPTSEITARDP